MSKKNAGEIRCKLCKSLILLANVAELTSVEDGIDMPAMSKKSNEQSEKISSFWAVKDMFAFENVGFCNTVDNVKYLACADCEVGPIGAHFTDQTTKVYYVAPERVDMSPMKVEVA